MVGVGATEVAKERAVEGSRGEAVGAVREVAKVDRARSFHRARAR